MRSPLMALPIASLVAKSFVAMSFVAMSFVAMSFVATSALALDLDVVNKSTTSLHHLYLSAPGADRWGDDQLGDGEDDSIAPGDTYTLENVAPGSYDVRLIGTDGKACILSSQRIGGSAAWTITQELLATCK